MDKLAPALIPLAGVDPEMVEQLLDRAFGPGRLERTAYKVRGTAQFLPALSFAMVDENNLLVATIQAWPVALTDPQGRAHPMIMVGPVAVLPEHQGEGMGTALMLAQAQALDPAAPLPRVMIGDEPYYGRFGYSAAHTGGWTLPGPWDPARLLLACENPAILPSEGVLGPWKNG